MNKKGFTLVELIATIAIILLLGLIIVPKVMNIINENRIKGYKEIERRLEEAAGKYIIENYVDTSLSSVRIDKNQLIEGKYIDEIYDLKDKSVCDASVIVSDLNNVASFNVNLQCSSYESMLKSTIHVEDLYYDVEKRSLNGLELTSDGNIRYTGNSPKNYVEFGNDNELWRIIGIFNVTTANGKAEKLVKIVRNDSIGGYSWDSSKGNNSDTHEDGEVNDGYGVNQWGEVKDANGNEIYSGADLKTELNTLYLNSESGYCCNNKNQPTCDAESGAVVCNFTNKGIKDTYRSMIESVVWNTAGFTSNASGITGQSAKAAYEVERITTIGSKGEGTGQICKGTTYKDGSWCTDEVTRTTTWTGKIGLIYPSDYGYASTNEDCRNWINASDADKRYCKSDNWLHNNTNYWTLSPIAASGSSIYSWLVHSQGYSTNIIARTGHGVRPSVYLNSNVYIASGEGTESNPYKLSVNS